MVDLGFVHRQLEIGEDLGEEEPRAEAARDEIGVLALPAEAGLLGQRLFHHRGGVDEDLHLALAQPHAPGLGQKVLRQLLEPALDDVVIVAVAGIDGDGRLLARGKRRQRVVVGGVAERKADHPARVRPQGLGRCTALRRLGHPLHRAVMTLGDEPCEIFGRLRRRTGGSDAHVVEAERPRLFGERGLQPGRLLRAQKSRSA